LSPGGHDPPDPVRSAFVMAVQLMEAGRASLLLRQDAEPYLTMAAAVGIETRLVESIRVPDGIGIAGIAAQKGITLLGRCRNSETFVVAPIVTHEGVEGVLNLTHRLGGRPFTGTDLTSSSFLAEHIAHLLEYRREALVDPVSGLPNRRGFEDALRRELARSSRSGSRFSVVYIDVDGLKQVNDGPGGHAAGDQLLRRLGDALREAPRQYDYAARIGGDEFAAILSDPKEDEQKILRRIFARAEGYSFSVGVSRFPEDARTAHDLLDVADRRMFEDKRRKRREL